MSIPVGATHVVADIHDVTERQKIMNGKHPYRKKEGNDWFAFVDGAWLNVWFSEPHRYQRLNKPWSGPEDGLPPVNTECEVETDYGVWEFCTVLAHGYDDFKPHAVAQCASGLWMEEVAGFRAIRTPEQLAAEQRETAIADMAKVLPGAKNECYTFNDDGSVRPYAHIHDVLGLLVDAGFKREVV